MKQGLELGVSQHLALTPQLQQAIRLLQLSTLDLQIEIREALEANPLLEADEETADLAEEPQLPVVPEQPERALEFDGDNEIPQELAVDGNWEDTFIDLGAGSGASSRDEDDGGDFTAVSSKAETLYDHLLWQLDLTPFSPDDRAIAELILDAIRPDGYLGQTIAELCQTASEGRAEPVDETELLSVLRRIQHFDPAGVGARDLAECLRLQVEQFEGLDAPLREAALSVLEYIALLGEHDYKALQRATGLPAETVDQAVHLIQALNPRPGTSLDADEPEYIVPDVLVRKINGAWQVELNPAIAPRLRINQTYAGMIRRRDSGADNEYLKNRLQEARWFINSLKSRNDTLLRVARAIVQRQVGFFEDGPHAMVPLVLQDIADELGLHQSTISRATNRKYMHTPRAIYELKFFFSSHVSTSDGGSASATAIRARIRDLIAAETPGSPLSDNDLAEQLQQMGINVARRTVAKYREGMGIASTTERRKAARRKS
ncbi:RNA polymerase factor sigma-54 [Immundisolibacter sp.]|uniref:RNA polymerase factor sigma-54 n=1 Tax=Immundisolibacter sp. TaxID=1934948 RepID=UPI0019B6E2A6|nr:RNA polymerase factor sigma-54 [Immundisolibacter sp.]MBC7161376.1 RNA polymerase factor sigma-54 [Immundisolibacter sp.]MEA3220915.1 RNA polymerase sigma-54 factor [Immundisolibacter sp.]